jgi:ketosteroid isomerase-like protein
MIDLHQAQAFAGQWISAWNAHDLDRILSHYTDDFIMESPLALKRLPETGGVVKGKEAVRAYWKMGLELIPNLHFELHEVLVGVNSITMYYSNKATGKNTAEVLFINEEGKAYRGFAHYN